MRVRVRVRLCSGKGEGEETFRGFVFVGMFCFVLGWVLWVTDGLSVGNRETWLSSTRVS